MHRICARLFPIIAVASLAVAAPAGSGEWQVIEKVAPYRVEGQSGIELYESIGHAGPSVGKGVRAIAHTRFKLTWRRDYQRRGQACTLASAVPKLVITYTLPKPAQPLSGRTAKAWALFEDGIARHERVHGEQIKAMTREIEAATVGFTVEDDPGCRKIRERIVPRLETISKARQKASNDFDAAEMGSGGTIERLVLDLVNGG